MTDSSRSALLLALSLADPALADALAERLRPQLLDVLADRFGLPEEMVSELLGADAVQMLAALGIAPGEWLLGAAELGDPDVGLALWQAEFRNDQGHLEQAREIPDLLPTLLHAADLADPRWYDDDGLFPLLFEVPEGPLLITVLTSGFPGVTAGTLAVSAAHLPPPVVVDACLGLLELWGSTEPFTLFLGLLEDAPDLDPGHPWLPGLLRQALDAPDPHAFLREHRPAGEWEDPEHLRALLALRYGDVRDVPAAKPEGLDWELIRREHERLPIGQGTHFRSDAALHRLARWEGCPADLVRESLRNHPVAAAEDDDPPFEAIAGPEERNDGIYLPYALERGIVQGRYSVDRVLAEVCPAAEVLESLPYDHGPTRRAVGRLLGRLGTDPVNWLTCYARMGRARGSVAELVADVTAPASRKKRSTSWPWPQEAKIPADRPENSRAAFLAMFRCVPEAVQKAVVPHLDVRAVQHLLVYGEPSPAVRDAVVAAHGLPAQIAMAASYHLSDAQKEYLLDLDEPLVDAQLFHHAHPDRRERERLLAGRLRNGGSRPVPAELLAVLESVTVNDHRDWFIAGLGSGDLGVARLVLGRLRLHVPAARTRLLTAVWERGGPDAVREILAMDRLPVRLTRWTERALDAPDGLQRLRARLAEEESPAGLADFLTATVDPHTRLRQLLAEGYQVPWAALVAAHQAKGLDALLLNNLTERPECPRELLLGALAAIWPGTDWPADALRSGRLTLDDLITHAAPAHAAYDCLRRYADKAADAAPARALRDRAAALTREHLGTDVEAWSVCLQLLPTFAGTLTELVATAAAMTRLPA